MIVCNTHSAIAFPAPRPSHPSNNREKKVGANLGSEHIRLLPCATFVARRITSVLY